MDINEQIAVMQAFRDGAVVECRFQGTNNDWEPWQHRSLNFAGYDYRIAPKRLTLVEELRAASEFETSLARRAADHIEGLERGVFVIGKLTTDELLAEIARRIGK
jgi:hypothetical protein